jgi:hypothetical protein
LFPHISVFGDTPIEVEKVELYAKENASNHRTDKYELVQDQVIVDKGK